MWYIKVYKHTQFVKHLFIIVKSRMVLSHNSLFLIEPRFRGQQVQVRIHTTYVHQSKTDLETKVVIKIKNCNIRALFIQQLHYVLLTCDYTFD